MTLAAAIRKTAFRWHSLVARSPTATRAYIAAVSAAARLLPDGRVRGMVEWAVTGQRVAWQPLAFAAREVIVGTSTPIRLRPHLGEFDQAALFHRRLAAEDPFIFNWLERHAAARYDAVIDIGANVGLYSLFFDALIRRAPEGRLRRVYAFEPSPIAYGRLSANLAANEARAVEAFAAAVADASGFAAFYQPEGHLVNGSLSRDFAGRFCQTVCKYTVVTLSGANLEELFARHRQVLVKIDAEGLEPRILAAMASILQRHRPDLLIEILQGVDGALNALGCLGGYSAYHLTPSGPTRRDRLAADPVCRDWLLTAAPLEPDETH